MRFFFSSFRSGARCSNQAEKYYTRGDGDFFPFPSFRFHFHLFCCCAVLCFRLLPTYVYRHKSISKEENRYTYVRHPRPQAHMWHSSWRRSCLFSAFHYYLPDLSSTSWFSPFLLARPLFLLSTFVSCACVFSEHGTAGEPNAVAGVSECWRARGRLQGARSPLSCLGVACVSRHEGCMNGLCLASIFYC